MEKSNWLQLKVNETRFYWKLRKTGPVSARKNCKFNSSKRHGKNRFPSTLGTGFCYEPFHKGFKTIIKFQISKWRARQYYYKSETGLAENIKWWVPSNERTLPLYILVWWPKSTLDPSIQTGNTFFNKKRKTWTISLLVDTTSVKHLPNNSIKKIPYYS